MRKREEILGAQLINYEGFGIRYREVQTQVALLTEVLLDIRELLLKQQEDTLPEQEKKGVISSNE